MNIQMKLSACVVVYNYQGQIDEIVHNINTYIEYIDILYVVDNSEDDYGHLFEFCDKIEYLPNYENLGVAHAFNIACNKAIADGYKFILTMDQDSSFSSLCIQNYIYNVSMNIEKSNIGLYSLNYTDNKKCNILSEVKLKFKLTTISSGAIVNLDIFKQIGGFNSTLFIDEVDNDYCLRLNQYGYNIAYFDNIFLNHNLGIPEKLIFNIYHKTHPPVRIYYMTRNNLYIWTTYYKNISFICF